MKNRDISNFHIGNRPITNLYREMQNSQMDIVEKFLVYRFDNSWILDYEEKNSEVELTGPEIFH